MTTERKTPYTKNTPEARHVLKVLGYQPLSFFQGKEFVYGSISNWANAHDSWTEKDYATFDVRESYHEDKESTLEEFIEKLKKNLI